MDARALRVLATLILYGSIVLALCLPATRTDLPLWVWSLTWAGLWLLFMGLLVVCDRSLFHYSFRMIGCAIAARVSCSVLIATFVVTHYHRLPYLHALTRGLTSRGREIVEMAPVAAAVVLVSYAIFRYYRRRERFFTALQ